MRTIGAWLGRVVLIGLVCGSAAGASRGAAFAADDPHAGHDGHEHHEHGDGDPHAGHADGDAHAEHADHDAPAFRVADFERHGVKVAVAAAGTVDAGVELPGEVRPNGDRLAHLAPRFAGLVREVRKRAGDPVRAGEVLAVIESETLAPFELKAAFDGIVLDRHVTVGEAVSRETPAFIVADLSTVWVDVHVYQGALAGLHVGQPVRIQAPGGAEGEGEVSYIAPVVDQATRTASARVVLPNADGRWRPGLFVTATILSPTPGAVVVPRRALHELEGKTVVFVAAEDRFTPRVVAIGRTGRMQAEITSGLAAGERFADAGSFLVKAELAKGEGGHDH